jgi:hypothetical protein
MEERLLDIASKYSRWIDVDEATDVYKYCLKKMDLAGIQNKDEYLPRLFDDELRHRIMMNCVNYVTKTIMVS